jgi:tRNA A-37 threonylcarbamoyl transferase component Bud32
MPTPKTECTELSVGFGLLELDPLTASPKQIAQRWDNTLSASKLTDFMRKFSREEPYYRRFYAIGVNLRHSHRIFKRASISSVRWEGPQQQASSVTIPVDIIAVNTPISIKADSHVVANPSPHILFHSIPSGTVNPTRSDNWYLTAAPKAYQALYKLACELSTLAFPESVINYHQTIKGTSRKRLSKAISSLPTTDMEQFDLLYTSFCHEVAIFSANAFNSNLQQSLLGRLKNSVAESIVRRFFRLGDSEYVLCGLDSGNDFGITIPDLTTWKRGWSLKHLVARPDLSRGQSVVDFDVIIEEKGKRREHNFPFHTEVRWSHGKFVGNPEAKLYKEFAWTEVPFFPHVYGNDKLNRLQVIGTGGYGIVYKAIIRNTGQMVAVKELDVSKLGFSHEDSYEERRRFEREVNIQSILKHKNILPVLDSDLSAATPWFATPLATCSVADIIDELRGNNRRINELFRQVLTAIEFAHQNNVIHRDLKPENILLFENDWIRVGDFGLGKQLNANDPNNMLTKSSNNSLGSLAYAAPEQMMSFRDADHRTDIYALGKTLLHMLTGKTLISSSLLYQADERYREFIQHCIQEEPQERYQSVRDASVAFEIILQMSA